MKGYAISENLNYLFTPKGVVKVFNDKQDKRYKSVIPYTMDNIDIAFDILKENLSFKYQTNKIDLVEYSNYPRKVLHKVLSVIKPHNNISIISEWELKFGQKLLLINESVDKLIVEQRVNDSINHLKLVVEQWYNPASWVSGAANAIYSAGKSAYDWSVKQGQEIAQKGFGKYLYDKGTQLWNSVSNGIASAWKCVTSGVECIMEGLRSILFSIVGAAAMGAVSFIPVVGQASNAILYGALLIWDIYKMLSGKYESGEYAWSWMDIIFDILSLIPGMGFLVKGAKTALVGVKSLSQLGKLASRGGIAAKIVGAIKSGISGVKSIVAQSAKFIGEKLGLKWLANWGTKATEKLAKIADDLSAVPSKTSDIAARAKTSTTLPSRAQTPGLSSKASTSPGLSSKASTSPDFKEKLKQIWDKDLSAPRPNVKTMAKGSAREVKQNAALCLAMGMDPIMCESPKFTQDLNAGIIKPTAEQVKQAEKLTKAMADASEKISGDF